ncbi:MAG: TolC family protein, partial [Thermodesulfobacteriota bacterium]
MSRKIITGLMAALVWAAPCFAGEPVDLSLTEALTVGITRNLDLKAARMSVPVRNEDVAVGLSAFDPLFFAQVYSGETKNLTGGILTGMEYERNGSLGAQAGVSKRFDFGMESSLSLETGRTTDNSLVNALDPNYRNRVLLNITQPLLRDFGKDVNTANVRLSENMVREASYNVLDAAERLGLAIENAYWSLSAAQAVVGLRAESRDLARDLVSFNEKRLSKGLVTVTEKAEAQAAAAAREEQVIAALQQAETLENRLKDLLE